MPRFYFDVTLDGVTEPDREGLELADALTARREAVRTAAEMARDLSWKTDEQDFTIQVRDDVGERVGTVRLSLKIPAPSR